MSVDNESGTFSVEVDGKRVRHSFEIAPRSSVISRNRLHNNNDNDNNLIMREKKINGDESSTRIRTSLIIMENNEARRFFLFIFAG